LREPWCIMTCCDLYLKLVCRISKDLWRSSAKVFWCASELLRQSIICQNFALHRTDLPKIDCYKLTVRKKVGEQKTTQNTTQSSDIIQNGCISGQISRLGQCVVSLYNEPFHQYWQNIVRKTFSKCSSCRHFSDTSRQLASKGRAEHRYRDPYAIAQARSRKAGNISRQAQLSKEKINSLGDPLRGKETPFVQAFDTAIPPPINSTRSSAIPIPESSSTTSQIPSQGEKDDELNYFLTSDELSSSLDRSFVWSGQRNQDITAPYLSSEETTDPKEASHKTASEALRRITSLDNASNKDRLRVNTKRCIATFGRHSTDSHLPAKPEPSASWLETCPSTEKTPRAGPDTGSSEVQIAILTARIRTLTGALETRGRMDKMNKRNLRLLVHKRQKLLKYLERKERGGARFRNVVDVLGLNRGMWEGEITLRWICNWPWLHNLNTYNWRDY